MGDSIHCNDSTSCNTGNSINDSTSCNDSTSWNNSTSCTDSTEKIKYMANMYIIIHYFLVTSNVWPNVHQCTMIRNYMGGRSSVKVGEWNHFTHIPHPSFFDSSSLIPHTSSLNPYPSSLNPRFLGSSVQNTLFHTTMVLLACNQEKYWCCFIWKYNSKAYEEKNVKNM